MNDRDEKSAAINKTWNDCRSDHDEGGDKGEEPSVIGWASEESTDFKLLGIREEKIHTDEKSQSELSHVEKSEHQSPYLKLGNDGRPLEKERGERD